MPTHFAEPALRSIAHYLDRCHHMLQMVQRDSRAAKLLGKQIAPDGFDTATHLAIAIQFAARAVAPPAGIQVPEIPGVLTIDSLLSYHTKIAAFVARIGPNQLCYVVSHTAGEAALTQDPDDYMLRFALPNMIFHLSMAYAALRQNGLALGKADFDGLHRY